MRKYGWKLLSLGLGLVLCLGLAVPALAADSPVFVRPVFVIEGTTLAGYNGPGGDVVIPDGVTRLSNDAFSSMQDVRESITSVTIPDSVTEISWGTFLYMYSLTDIHVSSGNPTFASVDGVLFDKSVTRLLLCPAGKQGAYAVPEGVTSIGSSAFDDCAGLTSVTIPDRVTSIEEGAFGSCTGLTSVALPSGLTRIETNTFSGCQNLQSVEIPDSVASIGESAFHQCFALEKVAIPDGVASIEAGAFGGCTALSEVNLPSGLTAISNGVFDSCQKLTEVVIPDSVTAIGENAFRYCTALAQVSIPASVAEIGAHAFEDTPWLAAQGELVAVNGLLLRYQGAGGAVVIPDGVTAIVEDAFGDCPAVTSVVIPEGVVSIGESAFWGCDGLTEIALPSTITWVGTDAFSGTPWLEASTGPVIAGEVLVYVKSEEQTFTVPEGVTVIGPNAFNGCPALTQVTFPSSVTSIDEVTELSFMGSSKGALGGCTELTDVVIENGDAQIGKHAFSWLKPGMMGTGTIMIREVAVHAPSGGAVEEFCVDNGLRFVSTGGTPAPAFSDVSDGDYFRAPVAWAAFHGITNGTGGDAFSPGQECTQVQILTFLWRAAGEPDSSAQLPFTVQNEYADTALRWAFEKGMIDANFRENAPCTRAGAVKFIWQAAGSVDFGAPEVFTDVPADADYAAAVDWAVGTGVTNGTGDDAFSPGDTCTRAQIVTFLYRARTSLPPQ